MVPSCFSRLIVRRLWKAEIYLSMSAEGLPVIVAPMAVAFISQSLLLAN
jgi:hypothetical protein